MTAPTPFQWTGRDASDAGLIACAMGVLRKVEHGEAIMETSIELQGRPPRLSDAWRFFHASGHLLHGHYMHQGMGSVALAARAQQMGARIALEVTGWTVTDMALAECGNSAGFGVFVDKAQQPLILPIRDTATGQTVAEWSRAFADATGAP